MSDVVDGFRAMREYVQDKRRMNTKSSTLLLIDNKIPFEAKNNGAHIIVDGHIDFWPSTGLWIDRRNNKRRRGVFSLISMVKGKI